MKQPPVCNTCWFVDKPAPESITWTCTKEPPGMDPVTGSTKYPFCMIVKHRSGEQCGYVNNRERTAEVNYPGPAVGYDDDTEEA